MKALEKSFKRYCRRVIQITAIPRQHFLPEHFHKLRVAIKKINALLVLTDHCSRSFKKNKYFRPFHILFHQAGKVRVIQLQIKFLKSFANLPGILPYIKILKHELSMEKEKFFMIAGHDLAIEEKKIVNAMADIRKKAVMRYLTKKEKQLNHHFHHNRLNIEKLHSLRKELKTWIYCVQSLSLPLSEKYMVMAEQIGQWHDYYVSQQQISSAMNYGGLPVATVRSLNAIQSELRLKEKNLLADIPKTMDTLKVSDK